MDQSPSYTLSPGLVVTSRSAVKFSNEPCSQQVIIQKWSSRPCSVLNGKKVSRAWGDLLTLPANCVCFNLPNRVLSEVKKDWIAESLRVPSPNPVLGTVASLNGFSLCFIVFCKIKPLIVIGVHVTQAVFFFISTCRLSSLGTLEDWDAAFSRCRVQLLRVNERRQKVSLKGALTNI